MAKKSFDFKTAASSLLFAMGARPALPGERLPFGYEAKLDTHAGRMLLTVHEDWVAAYLMNLELAKQRVKNGFLNKHSGKWNWHFTSPTEFSVQDLARNFAEVLVDEDELDELEIFSAGGPNTEFHYGYVDGSNHKSWGREVLPGRFSVPDAKVIFALTSSGPGRRRTFEFVPGQVGLSDLQGQDASMWIDGIDHAMHGIYSLKGTVAQPTFEAPSASDLVGEFVAVASTGGWDEEHKPAGYEEMRANALPESEKE